MMLLVDFQSIFNQYTTVRVRVVFPTISSSSEFLSLAPDSDIFKAIKRLRPSKSVGVDDISVFIIKGCTDIYLLVPVLNHILNLTLSQQYFPTP
jgi:hypothetical protein